MWSGSGSYRTEEDRRRWRRSGGRRNMPDERWREEDEYMDRGDRYSGGQGFEREPMGGRGQWGSQYGSEERPGRRYGGASRSSYGSPGGNYGTGYAADEYDEGERDYYGPSSSYETGRRWQEESPRSGGRDIDFNRGRGWYQDRGSSEQLQDGGMGRGSQLSRWGRNQGLYGPTEYGGAMSSQRMQGESYAGRGPKGWKRSDDRIRDEASEALARNPDIDPSDIEVSVQDGEVTLTGTVQDRSTKRIVEDIVEDVFGVTDVQNQLKVKPNGSGDGSTGDGSTMSRNRERESRSTSGSTSGSASGAGSSTESRPNRGTGGRTTTAD